MTAGQAARIIARSEAGWGRGTYRSSLGGLQRMYESRAADANEDDEYRADAKAKIDQTARTMVWVEGLIGSIPEPGADGNVDLQEIVAGVLHFIEHFTARKNALDHRAAEALAGLRRRTPGARGVPVPAAPGPAVRQRACAVAAGRDGPPTPRPPVRLQAVPHRLLRPSAPLRCRPGRRPRVSCRDRGRRPPRRRAHRHLAHPSPLDGSDRRSGICGAVAPGNLGR